jgi:DNA-binding HxlR family transcriptional regulator
MPVMRPYSAYDSDACSIARTLALIGDRWTLLVLRDVANGVRRFDELAGHLGIARNVLAGRLARLADEGLVRRTAYREPGARERHEYRLSDAGRELMPILVAFMAWGDRHLAGPEGPPAVVRHAGCGAPIRVSLTCAEGHELGERPALRVEPGPGSRMRRLPSGAADAPDEVLPAAGQPPGGVAGVAGQGV